ncbi:MAG: hypothetical protein N4A62_20465 [Marinisporobacter sp.]|nr:hypothetical protein [Marinisporobacter sp.]
MKSKQFVKLVALIICCSMFFMIPSTALAKSAIDGRDLTPAKINGDKFKIGYIESAEFVNYPASFYYLLKGLEEIKWIKNIDHIPFQIGQKVTKPMWSYLANKEVSSSLEFVEDFHYTLEYMNEEDKEAMRNRIEKNEVDLLIVLGTAAGKLVSNINTDTPRMIFSVTDAVKVGISENYERSNKPNIWAHTDPERFERQLKAFYDLFKFKNIGIVMENSNRAKAFTPLEEIKKLADEFGIKLTVKYVDMPINSNDYDRYKEDLKNAYNEISNEVDAFYITVAAIDYHWLEETLDPFYKKNIPVFSQLGGKEVAYGALMSINVSSFKEIGQFGARRIVQVLKGEKPEELTQKFVSTPQIDINLEVARKIEYPVSFNLLLVADQVYLKIERDDE